MKLAILAAPINAPRQIVQQLLIEHAAHWADRIWFHVGKGNLRSRRAMEKLGAQAAFEGKRPQNGEMIDFIYYMLDAHDWLAAQTAA